MEPKQHDTDQQQGYKAVQGMDREFGIRPVIGRPPQPGPPALADAEHLLDLRLAPVGQHHTSGVKLPAVRKEDRLAEVAMLELAFLAPIPLPMQILHLPVVQTKRKGKKRLEPVVAHQLRDLALDRFLRAGTVACDCLLEALVQSDGDR